MSNKTLTLLDAVTEAANSARLDIHTALPGRPGVSIPVGTVFSDEAREWWVLEETATLSCLSSGRIVLRSETPGKFPLQANAVLKMETVIVGVEKVVSMADATECVEEETNVHLLKRFMRSYSINNYDDCDGIRAELLALPDVAQAAVL